MNIEDEEYVDEEEESPLPDEIEYERDLEENYAINERELKTFTEKLKQNGMEEYIIDTVRYVNSCKTNKYGPTDIVKYDDDSYNIVLEAKRATETRMQMMKLKPNVPQYMQKRILEGIYRLEYCKLVNLDDIISDSEFEKILSIFKQ